MDPNLNLNFFTFTVTSTPSPKKSNKNQQSPDVDYDQLEDLMNRTFSDNDELDSTFTISRSADTSMFNCSSNGQSSSEDHNSFLNDTLPIISESEERDEKLSSTSKELNFELNAGDANESEFLVTRDGSTSSLTEESRSKFESNGKLSIESSLSDNHASIKSESGSSQQRIGKESFNQSNDPTDALMAHLVQRENDGKPETRFKFQQCNKKNSKSYSDIKLTGGVSKRKYLGRSSHELLNRKLPKYDAKDQGKSDNGNDLA